jgi:hypothetical protein
MSPTDKNGLFIYQMKILLEGITPPIYRRIQVPGLLTLAALHNVIQCVMGWTDCYLHRFIINGQMFGRPDEDESFDDNEPPLRDERTMCLADVVIDVPTSFTYTYDIRNDWRHTIMVEKMVPPKLATDYPTCLVGKRACPPEDVGGIGGYEELLRVIATRGHPEQKSMQKWIGRGYDPERFDRAAVNRRLLRYRRYTMA